MKKKYYFVIYYLYFFFNQSFSCLLLSKTLTQLEYTPSRDKSLDISKNSKILRKNLSNSVPDDKNFGYVLLQSTDQKCIQAETNASGSLLNCWGFDFFSLSKE